MIFDNDLFQIIVRHVLNSALTALAAKGIIGGSQVQQLLSALLVIISVGGNIAWSYFHKQSMKANANAAGAQENEDKHAP